MFAYVFQQVSEFSQMNKLLNSFTADTSKDHALQPTLAKGDHEVLLKQNNQTHVDYLQYLKFSFTNFVEHLLLVFPMLIFNIFSL